MTMENMEVLAKENGGIIPAGVVLSMTDFEIKRAVKAGFLKEVPVKNEKPDIKKDSKKPSVEKDSKKPSVEKDSKKSPKNNADGDKKEIVPAMNLPAEFTKEQKADYSRLDGIIYDRMNDMQKSSFDIAYSLHRIYENKFYKIESYKNIYEYARERFGIARGTTNNFINIVERFADLDKPVFELKPDYIGYNSTQLICMLGHMDDEFKENNISPSMSSREIKKALKGTDGDKKESAKAEAINALNGSKVGGLSDSKKGEKDKEDFEELSANVVLEISKSTLTDFPESQEDIEKYVSEILKEKVKVISKLLQSGHCIQILDIL